MFGNVEWEDLSKTHSSFFPHVAYIPWPWRAHGLLMHPSELSLSAQEAGGCSLWTGTLGNTYFNEINTYLDFVIIFVFTN